MSLRILDALIFIVVLFFVGIGTFVYSVKYYRSESRILGIGFLFFGIGDVCFIVLKVIGTYFSYYKHYMSTFGMIGSVTIFLGFVLMVIAKWDYIQTHPKSKKAFKVLIFIIIIDIILLMVLFKIYG